MLLVISPAKTLDFSVQTVVQVKTHPQFIRKSEQLIEIITKFTPQNLQKLLDVSDKLTALNYERFLHWNSKDFELAKQAVFAFHGDVYEGLNVSTLTEKSLMKLQRQLRILSGLYGVLKPFDAILPHRLEMGTPLVNSKGKDLYAFWGDEITKYILNEIDVEKHSYLVNLASNEYFKSVHIKDISIPIITPVFKDFRNEKLQMISFYAKRARGLMVRYIVENDVTKPEDLIGFDYEGYMYDSNLSSKFEYVFTR